MYWIIAFVQFWMIHLKTGPWLTCCRFMVSESAISDAFSDRLWDAMSSLWASSPCNWPIVWKRMEASLFNVSNVHENNVACIQQKTTLGECQYSHCSHLRKHTCRIQLVRMSKKDQILNAKCSNYVHYMCLVKYANYKNISKKIYI